MTMLFFSISRSSIKASTDDCSSNNNKNWCSWHDWNCQNHHPHHQLCQDDDEYDGHGRDDVTGLGLGAVEVGGEGGGALVVPSP